MKQWINIDKKIDPEQFPRHMQGDYVTRNKNIDDEKILCKRCMGTGNQLYSMYQKCEQCDGEGYLDEADTNNNCRL